MIVSVGAGLGVMFVPPELSDAVNVIVPATVPVAKTVLLAKTAFVDPAAIEKLALLEAPLEEMNWTSVGLPPTADWKLTESVPVIATGYALANVRLTACCVAGAPLMAPIVTVGVAGSPTVTVIDCVAVTCCESVTFKVTFEVPGAVGVPLTTPLLNFRPRGNAPAEMDQV